ncbi:ribonuclease H family protein [Ferrimonas gelatinilytica]|uniref:ribonuclease H n=1 Tax=Ferrimonas gelatinilytica TaxID=1255257 RepID=A0ABP9S6J9_9GAMM
MAKKFYVVWKGRQTGIFTEWPKAQAAVSGFAGAKYKAYPSRAEAMAALKMGHEQALGNAATPPQTSAPRHTPAKNKTPAAMPEQEVVIYCDGACDPNPGKAGSGVSVYQNGQASELWYGRYQPDGTNNTAELNALLEALKLARSHLIAGRSVAVRCDSVYAINCVSQWADGWKKRGWIRAGGPIQNLALIQTLHALWQELKSEVDLQHVKAHAGIEGNELADRMSVYAVAQQETGFVRYPAPFDLAEILAMRAG